ncbi:2-dehydropantoate 2-reductase [Pararobbsia alpina]|uniref:2-dehydropantoate 2-reductase n=1 Tax=Pararobbsia alpina TaxID=621374 RepID=A0A6S7BEY6_9BURK|nr:2-dehydropantoate 2-reductase [Pararobbsia alpina]CAB3798172.1 2-dehydropantoate 2-reductase [Pararobbsia alpina]
MTTTTIVGPGAIGGLLAAALSNAGHQVSLLARGATLAALRQHGLRVRPADGGPEQGHRLAASDDPTSFGVQDLVIVALKAQALPAMAAKLAPLVGPQTVIVSAMNGLPWWFLHGLEGAPQPRTLDAVDPDGKVSAALDPQRAIGCVVHLASAQVAPGVIQRVRANQLIVGSPHAALNDMAAHLTADLRTGGFEVALSDSIHREIWIKLWGNMNMNPISALTGSTLTQILDDPLTNRLAVSMMEEASAIGRKLGLDTGMTPSEREVITRKLGAFKTSMLQDFEAHREMEIGPILGVFPELGRKLGLATPHCDAILGLLQQRAANPY